MPYSEVALIPSELERKRIVKKLTCCVACREKFAGRDPEPFILWKTGDGTHHARLSVRGVRGGH
jgi:hypothetical protein